MEARRYVAEVTGHPAWVLGMKHSLPSLARAAGVLSLLDLHGWRGLQFARTTTVSRRKYQRGLSRLF